MSVADNSMSDAEPFLKDMSPPSAGLFTVPSNKWNTTNLEFLHHVGGKEFKEFPKQPHTDARRFPVPIEQVPDMTDFVYGEMPQALTLRPQETTGCCSCDFNYDVARDMFSDPVAEVKVQIPKMIPLFMCGLGSAEVDLTPKGNNAGVSYKGVLKHSLCPGCLTNDTELIWEGQPSKPRMTIRAPSQMDQLKFCMCQEIWIGMRGTSESVPQTQALYDNSTILRCSDAWNLLCLQCKSCQNACCMALDFAPRWTRPEDVRALVSTRYDYEFAHRKLDEEIKFEISEGETGEMNAFKIRQPAHKVDALLTGRLYMDVKCAKPYVRFAKDTEGEKEILAAVDARYRGSLDHANPSEDDHLIVLAGLILHALGTFPNKGNAPYKLGPADMFRGRLLPRKGAAGGPGGAMPSNAV